MYKNIPTLNGLYKINESGDIVTSIARHGTYKNRKIKQTMRKNYLIVRLTDELGNRKKYSVHRLVAMTFLKNPDNKPTVNHKNGVKTDNRVENLEWATWSENNVHALNTRLRKMPNNEQHWNTRISSEDVLKIRNMDEKLFSPSLIARYYGVTAQHITSIRNKRRRRK